MPINSKIPNAELFKQTADQLMEVFASQNFPESIAYTIIRKNAAEIPVPFDSYSLTNKLIAVFIGKTHDCRGYKQWSEVNRHVKKGGKSFRILAPLTRKVEEDGDVAGEKVIKTIVYGFKAVPVFADHQTEPDDPENDQLYRFDYTPEPAKLPYFLNVAEALGLTVKWRPMGGKGALGWYSPFDKSITMTSTDHLNYFHELAHAVHDTFEPLKDVPTHKAEAVAETSAAILCAMLGIEQEHQQQSYEYIQHYCKDKSPQGVLQKISSILATVEKVVTIILNKAKELEEHSAAENKFSELGGKLP